MKPTFYEFFAGGGMARAGLGDGWTCTFANDFDPMKGAAYAANWSADHLVVGDVAALSIAQLPGRADLAWASFPCQDLSLAGSYAGLGSAASAVMTRSGTFWPFWSLIKGLVEAGRAPRAIVLENVYGALTSRDGQDFAAIGDALSASGYKFGAMVVDASLFVPQSRQRVFFIAIANHLAIDGKLVRSGPSAKWHPRALIDAQTKLSAPAKANWLWWDMTPPPTRNLNLPDLIEDHPRGVRWHSKAETERLLSLMSPLHLAKVESAKASGRKMVGGVYRRTRPDARGKKHQRAEVRFDDVAGCLRTPSGGSSRQTILVVDGAHIRSRLLSPREAARLMGLPDEYQMPERYNDAYHVAGDGVCVPVVRHLAAHILEPLLGVRSTAPAMIAAE